MKNEINWTRVEVTLVSPSPPIGSATGNNTKETKNYHQGEISRRRRLSTCSCIPHFRGVLNGEGRLHYEGPFIRSSASMLRKLRDDLGILFSLKTRMHSSRMRTARSSSRRGGSPPGTPGTMRTPGDHAPPSPWNHAPPPPGTMHPPPPGTMHPPGPCTPPVDRHMPVNILPCPLPQTSR